MSADEVHPDQGKHFLVHRPRIGGDPAAEALSGAAPALAQERNPGQQGQQARASQAGTTGQSGQRGQTDSASSSGQRNTQQGDRR
jgi:hypothetical protein